MKVVRGTVAAILALAAAAGVAGPAWADSILFGQFGAPADLVAVANGATGVSINGTAFSISGGAGPLYLQRQGFTWGGAFGAGAYVMTTVGADPITIDFASAIGSFDVDIQSSDFGPFTGTITAYNAADQVVGTASVDGVSSSTPGSAPLLFVKARDITSVVISATNAGDGIAIAGVPEPAAWTTLLAGFALMGAAARRRRAAAAN